MRQLALFVSILFFCTSCANFVAIFDKDVKTSRDAELTKDEGRGTRDESVLTRDEGRRTRDESVGASSNDKVASLGEKASLVPRPSSFGKNSSLGEKPSLGIVSNRAPIKTSKGTYYFVKKGESLSKIARRNRISKDDLAQINNLYRTELVEGRRLFIPDRKRRKEYLKKTESNRVTVVSKGKSNAKRLAWPMKEYVLFSKFGWRRGKPHDGIDLSAKRGTPFYSAADGRVLYSKRMSGYGNLLVIKHADKYTTVYAHADRLLVKKGQVVKKGQKIGLVGTTGRVTGPHLHFEVHKGDQPIDPLKVLPKKK